MSVHQRDASTTRWYAHVGRWCVPEESVGSVKAAASSRVQGRGNRQHKGGNWWYRGTSLIRNNASVGPYRRLMPRALWGGVLMFEVPLYGWTTPEQTPTSLCTPIVVSIARQRLLEPGLIARQSWLRIRAGWSPSQDFNGLLEIEVGSFDRVGVRASNYEGWRNTVGGRSFKVRSQAVGVRSLIYQGPHTKSRCVQGYLDRKKNAKSLEPPQCPKAWTYCRSPAGRGLFL